MAEHMSEVSTAKRRPAAPRGRARLVRSTLHRNQIVATAVRIIDAEGVDALSMRRLGDELGSGATSVYRHVRDKDELQSLAFDAITGEIPLPNPGASWDDALVASARGLRSVFHRHPGFVMLIGHRAILGAATMDLVERLLGILRAAGFADQEAFHAVSAIANYATGFTILELLPGLRKGGIVVPEYRALIASYLEHAQSDAYPNATIVAPQMIGKADADFEYGVGAIVNGIRASHRA